MSLALSSSFFGVSRVCKKLKPVLLAGCLKERQTLRHSSTTRVSLCVQEMMRLAKAGASKLKGTRADTLLGVVGPCLGRLWKGNTFRVVREDRLKKRPERRFSICTCELACPSRFAFHDGSNDSSHFEHKVHTDTPVLQLPQNVQRRV